MREATNKEIMLHALKTTVIPMLKARGFSGKYPHYRRDGADCIALISFFADKYGGSFTVEVSAVFPDSADRNLSGTRDPEERALTVARTNRRYRLKGMFDGWFYYTDVYCKRTCRFGKIYYTPETGAKPVPDPAKGWRLVQRFDATAAEAVCSEVEKQLQTAFAWLDKFVRRRRAKRR